MNRDIRQFVWTGLLLAVLFAGAAQAASWTYDDSFSAAAETAREDAAIHSRFWVDRATPPVGPYIYYGDDSLVLMDYQNQLAEFGYCFPTDPLVYGQKAVAGMVTVVVSYPHDTIVSQDIPGELWVSTSGDGVAWSAPRSLEAGRHEVSIGSPVGTAYVRFSGTRVALESIDVRIDEVPATISVPGNYSTIQAAINAAVNGDVIEVGPGTYKGSGNQDIQFFGKAITLRSSAGPGSTIIEAASGHRGFYFRGGEGADTVVTGFTVKNGNVSGYGGGIFCDGSSPTITDCIVRNCRATYGGGIALVESDATVTLCDIEGNSASYGGGILCSDGAPLVGGCYFSGNGTGSTFGGGVYCTGMLTDVIFRNCVIVSNTASQGGGVYTDAAGSVAVANCTIADNTVSYGKIGGIYSYGTDIAVANSIIWGNGKSLYISPSTLSVTYCDIEGGYTGEGNFSADPQFAGGGDYHLQSRIGRYNWQWGWLYGYDSYDSPCIDAGDLIASVAQEPGSNGDRLNIGAYGGTAEASMSIEHSVYHVDGSYGSNLRDGLSPETAFKTISYALTMAQTGDTILVWPGVYREELTFWGSAVTVRSAADAAVLVAKDDYAVSFFSAEGSQSILSNFVIKGSPWGGIYCDNASPTLRNLTVVGNANGILCYNGAKPYIANCILWDNSGPDLFGADTYYCDISKPTAENGGYGDISQDPQFADPAHGDYHLRSPVGRYVAASDAWALGDDWISPCIDAGNPNDHFEAELEPDGDRINMGAYGGTPYASKSPY